MMENPRSTIEFVITGNDFIDCLNGFMTVSEFFKRDEKFVKRTVAAFAVSVGLAINTDFNLENEVE